MSTSHAKTWLQKADWSTLQAQEVPLLPLPEREAHTDRDAFSRGEVPLHVDEALIDGVLRLSHDQGVSLETLLLATWNTVILRYTGQTEILTGVQSEHWRLWKVDMGDDPAFDVLLQGMQENLDTLEGGIESAVPGFCQLLFVFGQGIQSVECQYDLLLRIGQDPSGLHASLHYNAARFAERTMQRLGANFLTLLRGIIEHPEQPLSKLPLVSHEERQQVLVAWNDTAVEYPQDLCVHQLFEEQARSQPDAVALVWGAQEVTYRELDLQATKLALRLQAMGVGPDVRVGICVERSVSMIVGILGILKAGGAYLPLDPSYPPDRLQYMLEDADVPVLLTQSHLLNSWSNLQAEVLLLDLLDQVEMGEYGEELRSDVRPESLCYVIYTSGSTGRPKGVLLSHRGAVNTLLATSYSYDLHADSRVLQFASISFDASFNEIFVALSTGAVLVLAEQEELMPGLSLVRLLQEQAITHAILPPSVLAMLPAEDFPKLRTVVSAGEACSTELASQWSRGRRFVNGYGPTETTVCASCGIYEDRCDKVTIGKPIHNVQMYILDASRQPVPIGVSGELFISGPGVALGYLGRPELTAEKFLPNPFSADSKERMYRTGDLVRWLEDGQVEFLGRIDHQVKIRGYRIELGEIEEGLLQQELVQHAVVLAREDVPGQKRLVAYVTGKSELQVPTVPDLRSHLQKRLPSFMIPSAFVVMTAFPLSPNGKVDRRALPIPVSDHAELEGGYTSPRTPLEETLAGIWSEVLGCARVGIHDGFLDIGGHSLLAIQILSRVREAMGVEVSLRQLYATPTVAGLAEQIERDRLAGRHVRTSTIERAPRDAAMPVSFSQERVWFVHKVNAFHRSYASQVLYHFTGKLHVQILEQALQTMISRHEIYRTTFSEVEGQVVQTIHPPYELALPVTSLLDFAEEQREAELHRLLREEMLRPFDMGALPLVRWTLYQVGPERFVMLHVEQHMVHDGWSANVFLRELLDVYRAFVAGLPMPLPEMPIQYADYAHWQRTWMQGAEAERQLAFWKQKLAGCQEVLELPTDRVRPSVPSHRGSSLRIEIPVERIEELHEVARREGVTLFTVMLAAFKSLLYRYTGQSDLLVGSGVANRGRRDVEGLIGMIVNTIVMRTELSGDLTFRELLGRVRETTLESFSHEDIPFEKVVEAINPVRDLSRNPLIQVLFSFHDTPLPDLSLPDVTLEVQEALSNGSAKFDLNVVGIPHRVPRKGVDGSEIGFTLIWEYSSDLFDDETMTRMVENYQTLLRAAIQNPEQTVACLPMLSAESREQLLVHGNHTAREFPRQMRLHELFEEQVERTPEKTALVFGELSMSYRELNERANQMARQLQAVGVRPREIVGLCVERSLEMMIGMLGILKAGATYLSLDIEYPEERLRFMLEDAGVSVLVTQEHLMQRLPEGELLLVLADATQELAAIADTTDLQLSGSSEEVAYVVYTSGSTGKPKGVEIPHRAVVRLIKGADYVTFSETEVFLQVASISFDAAAFEIWGSLLHGSTLVIFPAQTPTLEQLSDVIQANRVTTLFLTTALFHQMVETHPATLLQVKQLLVGGDVLSPNHVQTLLASKPDHFRLYNMYGPTESATFATCYEVTASTALDRQIPIGRPITNTECWVLDAHLQPVSIGVPGELCIGGEGLAHGYLNRPELTAEKFVAHPFSDTPSARLYRTGDLVRLLSDGQIEYLGRMDKQVKIRGYRIELGEVEHELRKHPSVRDAVVLASDEANSGRRLVAYVVPHEGEPLTSAELRTFLCLTLPAYMVPSLFLVLEELPLTRNGKVDTRELSKLLVEQTEDSNRTEAPRNPLEELMTDIFASILGVERLGIQDSFFEKGGHSLLATRLISRVRQLLGVQLTVRDLFEAPTVAGLVERLGLFEVQESLQIPLVNRDEALPLSFAQQRLWFVDRFLPGQAVYNMPLAKRLHGDLDLEALVNSLVELVQRHEALRTVFVEGETGPVQVIHNGLHPEYLTLHDLQNVPSHEREQRLQPILAQAATPFDLTQGPLFRAKLVRLTPEEHVLLLNMHHIVSDGWSLDVLAKELAALYEAFSTGHESPLAPLPLQYADYAAWQRQWLQGEVLAEQLRYWKQQLGGELPVLQLQTDRPRPAVQTYRGAVHRFNLSEELVAGVRTLSQREGATMFMTLLAAFQTLLARYTGQEDILVGTPVAGRQHADLEGLIGFFVNTLVLRTDLSGDPSFRDLLARVRETALGAYMHGDVPFEKLVEELQPNREMSHAPLCQVTFQMVSLPRFEMRGLRVEPIEVETGTAKFDMTVSILQEADALTGRIDYNTDLFDAETIARMSGHFCNLLKAILEQPEKPIALLPILGEAEQHQLLVEWNQTATDYPRHALLHRLFEGVVEECPSERVALVFEGVEMSYQELNVRANQLAHVLRKQGVQANSMVGLAIERSLEMVVAMLAIVKAGGVYVPLDPAYPAERLTQMMEDAEISVLLTMQRHASAIPMGSAQVLILDEAETMATLATENETNLPDQGDGSAEQLAYVMFTSGSTGRPKGVSVPHRAVVRLVRETDYVRLAQDEVFLQYAPISFDAATFEIWGSLLSGARLVVFPPYKATLAELANTIEQHGITTMFLTSSLFNQMVEHHPQALLAVPQLLTGGEALSVEHVKRMFELGEPWQLRNGYGPTESTTFAIWNLITEASELQTSVPIGRPLANTEAYVLDSRLQPVPLGVPGELFLGGDGLAHGYWRQEELTAEKFVPHPFSDVPEARLYRTGDSVRYLPDGTLDYLGRIDNQVKIRGFRIEMGEVEAALLHHPDVQQAVAIAREDRVGDKRLVAYVVARPSATVPTHRELRAFLKERLPEYMVPAAVVVLESLPLTRNGKVEVRALPAPQWEHSTEAFVAPRSQREAQVAEILAGVLQIPNLSVFDNFFELGGHSLLATQVISRLRSRFGVELSLRTLFEEPTVAGLTEQVEAGGAVGEPCVGGGIVPVQRGGDVPLSFAQQRLWFLDRLVPGLSVYNMPIVLNLQGTLYSELLEQSLAGVVSRHEALRTTFAEGIQGAVQHVHEVSDVAWVEMDLTELDALARDVEAQRLIREEAWHPFDLTTGPLLRARLLKLAADEHVLILNLHHIVGDGWSLGVFAKELATGYDALLRGDSLSLEPSLPIQYADYAIWQREQLQASGLEREWSYWKTKLGGELPILQLPTDRPRPHELTYNGAMLRVDFPATLIEELRDLSQQAGTTLYMTMLAAFKTLLYRYSGQNDLCVGTMVAGRNRAELEGLIGFFVNTLVLRTDLSGQPTFRELLERVGQVTLEAFAHQEMPFELLVERLQVQRDSSRSPLFQVAFQSVSAPNFELAGLAVEHVEQDVETTKFDLTVTLVEGAAGWSARFDYNTDLFEQSTIQRMQNQFLCLLRGVVEAPEQTIDRLPLLTDAERHQLLIEWNETTTDYPRHALIHRLFEEQAERAPERVAVVCEDRSYSYGEVNARANQMAHYLRQAGVSSGSPVGICLPRSVELVIAVLAILKAGGGYVPLDPAYPRARLAQMLEDAQVSVVLTRKTFREALPLQRAQLVVLDQEAELISVQEMTNLPEDDTLAESLAYLIFTSGSTGRPKGVMIPHRAVVRLVKGTNYVSFSEHEVFLQFAPISFDAATFEIWGALLNGASLVVLPPAQPTLAELAQAIESHGITAMFLTAALFNRMVEHHPQTLLRVPQLLAGGEAISAVHVRKMFELGAPWTFRNGYGPTESTTFATCQIVTGADEFDASVAIGRPISNTEAYVLDACLQPVPIGVPGELFLGGDGLAMGYLQPELTAEKFVAHPFSPDPKARLYRTGDLVRYLSDGRIEYLGRLDKQVKIRGFRIEVGEVEASICRHPSVREAFVKAQLDGQESKSLIAYVVQEERVTTPDARELRHFLKTFLPDYLIPNAFVILESLPLTPNGKVDTRSLPLPKWERDETWTSPRDEVEAGVARLFAEQLGCEEISVFESFFDLGGSSLSGLTLLSALRRAWSVDVPMNELFRRPTVAELASYVRDQLLLEQKPSESVIPARPANVTSIPLSFDQEELWRAMQEDPTTPVYNVPISVRLRGNLNVTALEHSLQALVARHEALRTRFVETDNRVEMSVEPHVDFSLSVLDLQNWPVIDREGVAGRLAILLLSEPFSLAEGRLFRAFLLKVGQEEYQLLLVLHHIVTDGWSNGVLFGELRALYQAYVHGEQAVLPQLPIHFADYVHWQKQRLQGEVLEGLRSYWLQKLANAPAGLDLPTDHPRPTARSYQGGKRSLHLPDSLVEQAKEFARQEGVTMFMLLLTVFKIQLHAMSGQEDILVGTPMANRDFAQTQDMIGYLLSVLILRSDLSGDLTFRELFQQVRETTVEAFAHKEMPVELLIRELGVQRDLSRNPLYQVMFVYYDRPEAPFELPGLQVETELLDTGTSEFELMLVLGEREGKVAGRLEYSSDLYEPETVDAMGRQFVYLVEAILKSPDQKLSEFVHEGRMARVSRSGQLD